MNSRSIIFQMIISPAVNGNVIHFGSNGTQSENGAFTFEMGNEEQPTENTDYTKQFVAQVSYEEFQELMKKQKVIIGTGSNYSMENLLQYYGLAEMTYEEAMNEYEKTIYDDKVSAFCKIVLRLYDKRFRFISCVLSSYLLAEG